MANQFPTESTTTGSTGSTTGLGSSSGTGSSTGTSIGNASGFGSGSTGSSSGSGYGGPSSSTGGSSFAGGTSLAGGSTTTGERTLDRTMDKAVQVTHQAVDRAAGTVGQAANKLRSGYDQLLEMEAEWADTARSRVRESPLAAVGIALAVGLVLGRLTAHR